MTGPTIAREGRWRAAVIGAGLLGVSVAGGCATQPPPAAATPAAPAASNSGVLAELSPQAAAQAQAQGIFAGSTPESRAEALVLAHLRGDARTLAQTMGPVVKLEGVVIRESSAEALEQRLQAFYKVRTGLHGAGAPIKVDRRITRKDVDTQFSAPVVQKQVTRVARDIGLPPPDQKDVGLAGILTGGRLYLVITLSGKPVAITSQDTPKGM
jgi:hypothetical protein